MVPQLIFRCGCRYLLLEFPALAVQDPPQHFLELGCGCGSSLLPILKANPSCRVTASDVSATAVSLFQQAAAQAGIDPARIRACVADDSDAAAALPAGVHWGAQEQMTGSVAAPSRHGERQR